MKRLVSKLSWFFLHHQVAYNTEVLDTLSKDVLGEAGLVGRLDAHEANADAMGVEFRTLGRDLWAAIAAQTAHLDQQNGEMWAAIAAQSGRVDAQNAELWAAVSAQTKQVDAQNAELWSAVAAQSDRLQAQSSDLWAAIGAQTDRVDALAAELWAAVAAQTDQIESLGEDLWEAVHKMWAAIKDGRELLDQEQMALKIHVDLMQRQAFSRLHEGVGGLRTDLVEMSLHFGEVHKQLAAVRAEASLQLGEVNKQIGEVTGRLEAAVGSQIADIHMRLEAAAAETRRRQGTVDALLDKVRRSLPEPMSAQEVEALPDAMSSIYPDFEDVFRVSVSEFVKAYLPDVLALDLHGPVADLGSGRGEWLEVLKEAGVDAYGVDLSQEFVDQCLARGLKVVLGDACEHLAEVPERSLSAITAFHLVEHVPVNSLIRLIDLSVRALQPGGVLILETPNPENLIVGSSNFYLDPGHVRPLPPGLLSFLVEARGFAQVETRFLRPISAAQLPAPAESAPWSSDVSPLVNLMNSRLFGPQDYAVIGRRL